MKNFGWLKYRYPALNEAELEMESSLRDLERTEARKRFRQRLSEESVDDDDIRFSITGHINESINANYPLEPCADLSINDSLPYSKCLCAEEAVEEPVIEYEEPCDFELERERMMQEVRVRIEKLRALGVDELMLRKLFEKEDTLSRLVITRDYRIILPDYHNMEIEMTPLPKALFLLYLKHEEGISFKFLTDYEDELRDIYMQLTDRVQPEVIEKSIQAICDPTQNAINEKCTRIREAFIEKFDYRLAQHYFITGKRGEVKRIQIQRDLVIWEQ